MGDPHADFSTPFVSQLVNRSILIGSEATERDSLSVAHKVFPRSVKERVKIEGFYIKRVPHPFFTSMYFLNFYLCITLSHTVSHKVQIDS